MKKIKLRDSTASGSGERISSAALFRLVTTSSPNKPLSVDEIRRRVRVLDALDNTPLGADTLQLEDDDCKTLAAALDGFPWASAQREILMIIDDVLKAEPVPPHVKLVEKD